MFTRNVTRNQEKRDGLAKRHWDQFRGIFVSFVTKEEIRLDTASSLWRMGSRFLFAFVKRNSAQFLALSIQRIWRIDYNCFLTRATKFFSPVYTRRSSFRYYFDALNNANTKIN